MNTNERNTITKILVDVWHTKITITAAVQQIENICNQAIAHAKSTEAKLEFVQKLTGSGEASKPFKLWDKVRREDGVEGIVCSLDPADNSILTVLIGQDGVPHHVWFTADGRYLIGCDAQTPITLFHIDEEEASNES